MRVHLVLLTASVLLCFEARLSAAKLPELAEPVKILAAGKPIAVEIGHASPFVYDFDKDGKKDLLVGQFGSGKCRVYLNKGTDASPKFDDFTFLKAEGTDAAVPPSWCIGFDPQVVDLNGDGTPDIVSGRYFPPLVSLFEGTRSGFKKSVFIEEDGIPAQTTGDAVASDMYQCVACLADLTGDGALDIIVGNNNGELFINDNQGTARQFKFGRRVPLLAGGKPMKVPFRSRPVACDWDGDGVLDLLVGDEKCGVTFFKGVKSARGKTPEFEAGVPVITGKPAQIVPGYRARPAVADWNNDGKLDLLVGNCEPGEDRSLTGHVYLFLRK